ncbi:hypothetical protein SAMN05421676_104148 [Salinibacillus kushneri]|uniref:Uncharacterized protein n=1 Tax=Salinibacillus kushneri TaxID=237682 RepID=A0A1I0DTD5_9BACI|nr:hypothetical protein [Salinibacillus kushneri]SET35474.1 hypothetical protein SAMN05421676_104148 [Salinibacillus kushneri]
MNHPCYRQLIVVDYFAVAGPAAAVELLVAIAAEPVEIVAAVEAELMLELVELVVVLVAAVARQLE